MTKLNKLHLSYSYAGFNITSSTFKAFTMSNIKELILHNCWLSNIAPQALSHFHHLKGLVIACNYYLTLKPALTAVKHISSRQLDTLILDGLQPYKSNLNSLVYSDICTPVLKQLRRLTLRGNGIVSVDLSIFNTTCLPRIEYIGIGFNQILNIKPSQYVNLHKKDRFHTNVKTVDISNFWHSWYNGN